MGRSVGHLALGSVTAVVFGLLAFAARGALLPAVDDALARVTLLRAVIALAGLALLHVALSLWGVTGDRLPAWRPSALAASVALGALVGSTAGAWAALNVRVTAPTVFADEMIFMNLAKSLSRGDGPVVRGVETLGYGLAYPALLTPAYALAGDGVQAYTAAQVMNAVVMASAAVPAYLLSRLVLERGASLLVAAFTVATPLLWYSGYVMTEALFYPAFLWTAYAVARALARPSTTLQAIALGSLVGLCTVRPQAVVLIPAAASAVGLVTVGRGWKPGRLRRYGLLLAGLGGVAVAGGAVRLLSSFSPVGAYDVLLEWPDPLELLVWAGREIGGLTLAVGIVSAVVFPIATTRMLAASASDEERALGATSLAFVSWMIVSVVVLDSSSYGLGWTHLRNLIATIPLVILAGVAWVGRGMPRPAVAATVGGTLALLGALAVRSSDLEHVGRFDAPSFLPWQPFASDVLPLDRLLVICVAVAVVVALTTRARWALPVSVLVAFVVVAPQIVPRDPPFGVERDRIAPLAALDREVTRGGRSVVIAAGLPDARCDAHALALLALWTEVLNISAQARRLFGHDLTGSSPSLSIAPDGTLLDAGTPLTAGAVAIDERVSIEGVPIATVSLRDLGGELAGEPGGLRFWRTNGPVRLTDREHVVRLAQRMRCPVTGT